MCIYALPKISIDVPDLPDIVDGVVDAPAAGEVPPAPADHPRDHAALPVCVRHIQGAPTVTGAGSRRGHVSPLIKTLLDAIMLLYEFIVGRVVILYHVKASFTIFPVDGHSPVVLIGDTEDLWSHLHIGLGLK